MIQLFLPGASAAATGGAPIQNNPNINQQAPLATAAAPAGILLQARNDPALREYIQQQVAEAVAAQVGAAARQGPGPNAVGGPALGTSFLGGPSHAPAEPGQVIHQAPVIGNALQAPGVLPKPSTAPRAQGSLPFLLSFPGAPGANFAAAANFGPAALPVLPSFALPPDGLQLQHPVTPGCLLLMTVMDRHGALQWLHLLRVRQVLGEGGNGMVWLVGHSRNEKHRQLLYNQQDPWAGIGSWYKDAAVAAWEQEQPGLISSSSSRDL